MSGSIVVKLDLDGDRFTAKITGATEDLSRFNKALGITDKSLASSEKRVQSWGRRFRDTVIIIGLARHALLNLNDIILGLPRSIIKANAELERMEMLMVGLSNDTGGFESISKAAKESVDYVFQLARTAPFEVQSITDSFVKLKASGIDPMNGSLDSLINSVAKFGGTSENLKRASIAIQQMSGKGVISMEELRQQLGEAVPNAVMLMARALDVSMGELVDKIATGTVEAQSALTAMFRQMELENGGSALRMANTWEGIVNRMRTRFMTMAKEIGDAGFYDEAKNSLRAFTDEFLTSAEAINFARALGSSMAEMIRILRDVAIAFVENIELIKSLTVFIIKLKVATIAYAAILKPMTLVMANWNKILAALVAAFAQFRAGMHAVIVSGIQGQGAILAAHRATAAYAATMTTTSAKALTFSGALSKMRAALLTGNGATIAAVAVGWGLYEVWNALTNKGPELQKVLEDFDPQFFTKSQLRELDDSIAELEKKAEATQRKLQEVRDQGETGNQRLDLIRERRMAAYSLELAEETEELRRAIEVRARAQRKLDQDAANAETTRALQKLADDSIAIQAKFVNDLGRSRDEIFKLGLDGDEESEVISLVRQGLTNEAITAKTRIAEKLIENYWDQIRQAQESGSSQADLESLYQTITNLEGEIERLNSLRVDAGGLVEVINNEDLADTPLERFLTSVQKKIDTLEGKINETSPELEQFNTLLAAGEFDDVAPEDIARAKDLISILKQRRDIWDAETEATRVLRRSIKSTNEVQAQLSKTLAESMNDNPYLNSITNVENFRQELLTTMEDLQQAQDAGLKVGRALDQNLADGIAAAAEEMSRLNSIRIAGPLAMMRREAESITDDLLTDRERLRVQYDRQIRFLEEVKRQMEGIATPDQIARIDEFAEALGAKFQRDFETPVQTLIREWQQSADQMLEVWGTAMSRFSEVLTNGLVDGKAKFADFAKEILKMILKIQLQKLIAGIADFAIGNFSPKGIGGTANVGSVTVPTNVPSGSGFSIPGFAIGGIMSANGVLALKKYAKGGIADRPQMAIFGEGSTPEAYVPLPDGRTIPVTLDSSRSKQQTPDMKTEVNVINQTSMPVTAEKVGGRFDGSKYIVDVVLRELGKPGPFRDAVKGAR